MQLVDIETAKSIIADAWLSDFEYPDNHAAGEPSGDNTTSPSADMLGHIVLHPHQQVAVNTVRMAIAEFGGALLCDEVGMGKTFVALAIASSVSKTLVIAPAVLRTMWQNAADRAMTTIQFHSYEALSRGCLPGSGSGLVVLDEAHHARNAATRRFAAIAQVCTNIPTLLLTATPVHNQRSDLTVLLSLFLGARAERLTAAEMGRCVIRRNRDSARTASRIPVLVAPRWLEIRGDDSVPELLLALPPPLPPRDGGDGGVLIVHSLIRQWASSDAALRGGLKRRLHRAIALTHALESGVYPSESDLGAWVLGDDSMQLAFPLLVAPARTATSEMLASINAHADGVRLVLSRLRAHSVSDADRAKALRDLTGLHAEMRIVAFSQYADTVEALFTELKQIRGVAALTGRGARVAGGIISRHEAICRFAPHANGVPPPKTAEAISLLLTTDLLSEGVNLQDAAVVVHLDLPWTGARIEQRVGRAARMGSTHHAVYSYAMRPPARAESLIRIEQTLERKLQAAGHVTGTIPPILPSFDGIGVTESGVAATYEAITGIISGWRRTSPATFASSYPLIGVASSSFEAMLALCRIDQCVRFVCSLGDRITDDPIVVLEVSREMGRAELASRFEFRTRLRIAGDWIRRISLFLELEVGLQGTSADAGPAGQSRRRTIRRISSIVDSAPPHVRHRIGRLASHARTAAFGRLGADSERRLDMLSVEHGIPDEEWLERVVQLGRDPMNGDARSESAVSSRLVDIVALIVLHPQGKADELPSRRA
ncbi:MAG TPA: helicase-related protein [Gemmatimonadaceae bacterium]|nr:helicase-related protein [Gemmatimonadaceae bacterium]